jgi:hypothetical protein
MVEGITTGQVICHSLAPSSRAALIDQVRRKSPVRLTVRAHPVRKTIQEARNLVDCVNCRRQAPRAQRLQVPI